MKRRIGYAFAAGSLALLAACGGGGGGGGAGPTNVSAEGAWQGTTSTNYVVNMLALENNDFYTIFGVMSGSSLLVYGFDQGSATQSGSSFSGTFREYPNGQASYPGSLSGTVVANTSIAGTSTYANGSASFSVTPIPTSAYNYNRAASLGDIQGSWNGTMSSGVFGAVTISSTGAVSGSSGGCLFTGTATPRASGKNVFNLSVTFGASPCALPGQTVTGIAIDYAVTGTGQTQLIVALQDSTRQNGTMFVALR